MAYMNINRRDNFDDERWRWHEERRRAEVMLDSMTKQRDALRGDLDAIFTRLEKGEHVELWLGDGRGMRVSSWEPIGRGWPSPTPEHQP